VASLQGQRQAPRASPLRLATVDPDRDGHGPEATPIPPARAVVLGAVQGPTELLPVSSSAHLTLIPWLAGWEWKQEDPELRKSFEVALHAGAAAALLLGQRLVIAEELRTFDRRKGAVLALSFLPAAAFGVALERPIERRLGGPLPTAIGLLIGAAAMALADSKPQKRERGHAVAADGLALGLAQAAALAPGISRNGATLTAARWRGFTRQHANMLSRTVALPVIVAAAVLKGARLRRRGLPAAERTAFAAGTATSFVSTLASQFLIRLVERDSALWPYAAYRAGLAGVVLGRLWRSKRSRSTPAAALEPGDLASGDGSADGDSGARANGAPSRASDPARIDVRGRPA
jgi:undecaprenyl-diphosphatase